MAEHEASDLDPSIYPRSARLSQKQVEEIYSSYNIIPSSSRMGPQPYRKMKSISLNPYNKKAPSRHHKEYPQELGQPVGSRVHPQKSSGDENASVRFVGNATTIISFAGARVMTDPNFLHKGDHVHLGPGVEATRTKDPAMEIHELPHIDAILLSHYHGDHWDRIVEDHLRKDIPIITTPHAKSCLEPAEFTAVTDINTWEELFVNIQVTDGAGGGLKVKLDEAAAIRVQAMPGKHVPPGPLSVANDLIKAIPPVNGWIVELGYGHQGDFRSGYRIYITGDTLMISDLQEIPRRFQSQGKNIDLMLIHLGGTTIPGPSMPLLMVTMDANQGVEMLKLIGADITIPIHFDDYDVFMSPLKEFIEKAKQAAFDEKRVVQLERGEEYKFTVRNERSDDV